MAYPTDEDIIKLLGFDCEKKAAEITGEDGSPVNLGFMMNVYNEMTKKKVLKSIGDTVFNMDWLAYCELIETFGFGLMMEDFSPDGGKAIRIYYHEKDGLLLVADSYLGSINAARVYYNWKPNVKSKKDWTDPNTAELVNFWEVVSSGGFYYPGHIRSEIPEDVLLPAWDEIIWSGNHDAREALGFNLRRLRENGTFIPEWKERPYLWLMGGWETGDKDKYGSIIKDRIKRLPQWVQDRIKGI